jgi:hypothetical protein
MRASRPVNMLRQFVVLTRILLVEGPGILLSEISNRRKLWTSSSDIADDYTSISSGMAYSDFCREAVETEATFIKFKSAHEYRAILEHLDHTQGKRYLELIRDNQGILENLKMVSGFEIGNPFIYPYKGLGKISPTQIRYAKVLQDLEILFGKLSNISIAEIGAGYGGQAAHILARFAVEKYSIYDLEWAGKLALKYLERSGIPVNSYPVLASVGEKKKFDLVISNYAFSELYRETQELYFENVIANSKAGYVIYNHIHSDPTLSLSAEEFAARIHGAEIFQEIPKTFPGNVLVVWGHSSKNLPRNLFKN